MKKYFATLSLYSVPCGGGIMGVEEVELECAETLEEAEKLAQEEADIRERELLPRHPEAYVCVDDIYEVEE